MDEWYNEVLDFPVEETAPFPGYYEEWDGQPLDDEKVDIEGASK